MSAALKDLSPERLQALSPQLRKAARYVVEFPGEIATRSQRHAARVSNLPAPTFTRLAHAVGYESYDALREDCRQAVLEPQTTLADRAMALVDVPLDETGEESLFALHGAAMVRNTQALLENIDQMSLAEAVRLLADAPRVALVGELSARAIVDYAAYVANMSLTGWSVLGRTGEILAAELAQLGPKDACIVLSFSPYAARSIQLAQHLRYQDVPMIVLTDNALSPAAALACHTFFISTECPQFFPSHGSATIFFEALIGMVIRESGKEAQQHIAAVERQNHKLNAYWQDAPAAHQGD